MKTIHHHISIYEDVNPILDDLHSFAADFIIIFTGMDFEAASEFYDIIKENSGCTNIIGCSTAGEIGEKFAIDDSISISAVKFDSETSSSLVFSSALDSNSDSYEAGKRLSSKIPTKELKAIFVISPGVNVNGSALVDGLAENMPDDVIISGGLAGDGTSFESTYVFNENCVHKNQVAALAIYGEDIIVSSGSEGGWKVFGPNRRVTASEENILYELDEKPALELYKQYLGEKANSLPSSGLLYPLALIDDNSNDTGLIRTILDIDHEKNSLTFAGNIPKDALVCLMHSDSDSLVQGAADAAGYAINKSSAKGSSNSDALAILVSCVGRKLVMGDDVDEEVEVVQDMVGENANICGFYSYGEISNFKGTNIPKLHNQTMTITCIQEKQK